VSKGVPQSGSGLLILNWAVFRYRFVGLLCALTLLLIASPILNTPELLLRPKLARIITTILFGITLLTAVFTVSRSRTTQVIAVLLGVPAIILQGFNVLAMREGFAIPAHLFALMFLAYTVCILLGYLFSADRVNVNTICASLCAYLLLGVLWAIGYSLLDILSPTSFSLTFASGEEESFMRFGGENSVYPLYYSLVTMTTLGYGDITPASSMARMLAALQAVVGQVYLAVLVARLVGLHISQPARNLP
jgi:voltage-gated potassium channel